MGVPIYSANWLSNARDVLMLYLVPVGGGIPAGVLLARSRSMEWPEMMLLYFISDVILACVFEPFMLVVIALAKRSSWVSRMRELWKSSMKKVNPQPDRRTLRPLSLVLVAFGVDPMTGRSAAASAGHGFISGWALAIAGDMMYFTVLMASTLWLNQFLGDGDRTMGIILLGMFLVPYLVRKFRRIS